MSYSHYSTGDPELLALSTPILPPPTPTPYTTTTLPTAQEIREQIKDLFDSRPKKEYDIKTQDLYIPVKDGKILLRHYVPNTPREGGAPLLLWFHAGGYIVGAASNEDPWCSLVAERLKLSVINVDYRLAPEFPFPTAVEDSYAALLWALEHSKEIGADPTKGLIIGGGSAGGCLSTVLSTIARDDPAFPKGIKVTGQVLHCPYLCLPPAFPEKYKSELKSYEELVATAPIASRAILEAAVVNYAPPDPTDWRVSPLYTPSLAGLPPALIQIAGWDPLRDEGIIYARMLQESGVDNRFLIYPGAPHMFATIFLDAKTSKQFMEDAIEGIDWLIFNSPRIRG